MLFGRIVLSNSPTDEGYSVVHIVPHHQCCSVFVLFLLPFLSFWRFSRPNREIICYLECLFEALGPLQVRSTVSSGRKMLNMDVLRFGGLRQAMERSKTLLKGLWQGDMRKPGENRGNHCEVLRDCILRSFPQTPVFTFFRWQVHS
jgi:hypothetical protein